MKRRARITMVLGMFLLMAAVFWWQRSGRPAGEEASSGAVAEKADPVAAKPRPMLAEEEPVDEAPRPAEPMHAEAGSTARRMVGADAMPTSMLPELHRALIAATDTGTQRRVMGQLADTYARFDPVAGIRFFEELVSSGDERAARTFLREFADTWSGLDPAAAGDWIGQLPPAYRNAGIFALIMEGAQTDLPLVGNWILKMDAGPHKTRAVDVFGQFFQTHAGSDYYNEWAWQLTQSAEDPAPYLSVISSILTQFDPEWTFEFLASLEDPEAQRRGFLGFVEVMAKERPREVLDWTGKFEDSALRAELSGVAIQKWSAEAPAEAAQWLLGSTTVDEFDNWASIVVRALSGADVDLRNQLLNSPRMSAKTRAYLRQTLP